MTPVRRAILYWRGIDWQEDDGRVMHGGWVVLEGRGCVMDVVAGPFATREEAEAAL